jgi:hypothetical protein
VYLFIRFVWSKIGGPITPDLQFTTLWFKFFEMRNEIFEQPPRVANKRNFSAF